MAQKSKSQKPVPNNFLEALRDLSTDFTSEAKVQVTRMVRNDVPESFGLARSTPGGTLSPNESVSLTQAEYTRTEIQSGSTPDAAVFMRLRQLQEEDARYRQKEMAQIKEQIKMVQDETKLLAKSAGEFSQEIEVATFQAVVSPGAYHKNFFSHLKSLLVSLRMKVSSSRHWLAEHNSRAKKRGHFWGQVSKSGTSYMLSSERYAVMSTG